MATRDVLMHESDADDAHTQGTMLATAPDADADASSPPPREPLIRELPAKAPPTLDGPDDSTASPSINRDPSVSPASARPGLGGFFDKVEAFISRLSMRDNFWNSVCSLI